MGMLPLLAKQSTDSTGTASVALNAAPAKARAFSAAFGATSVKIRYVISWDAGFEIGIGTFDGGTPGGLARDQVLLSSNADALVALPAGTKDVYAWIDPHAREIVPLNAGATLTLAQLGNLVLFTGSSDSTIGLPPYASMPLGSDFEIANDGPAFVFIDPNAAETIGGLSSYVMYPGDHLKIYRVSNGWLPQRLNSDRVADLQWTASSMTPSGWLLCAGQAVSRATYAKLFRAIGVTYGAGDGGTTFNVPDIKGRAAIGLDNMGGAPAGRVTGNSGVPATSLGAAGGHELLFAHAHGVADPGHNHGVNDPGHSHNTQTVVRNIGVNTNLQLDLDSPGGTLDPNNPATTTVNGAGISIAGNFTGISIHAAGGGNAQNMPPFIAFPVFIYAGA